MHQLFLEQNDAYPWYNENQVYFKGYAFDQTGRFLEGDSALKLFRGAGLPELNTILSGSEGVFSLIIRSDEGIFLGSDPMGFFPVFYGKTEKGWWVSDKPSPLPVTNHEPTPNTDAFDEFLSAGHVMGNETLLKGVYRVRPGELVRLNNDQSAETFPLFEFLPSDPSVKNQSELKNQLLGILDRASRRLVSSLNGKTAVVPLSGGYDSRLIACMLKKAGYKKVVCFTYGRRTHETDLSERIAGILGYPWVFVNYESLEAAGFLKDPMFLSYCDYAGNLTSMPFLQEYFGVKYLQENRLIPGESIFLPGHPGDNLGGSFIAKGVKGNHRPEQLSSRISRVFFNFIPLNRTRENMIGQRISELLDQKSGWKDLKMEGYSPQIEGWNFSERLPKFIFNSARVFPFFHYGIRFPLWSRELADFFRQVPYGLRENKRLYNMALEEGYFKPLNLYFEKEEVRPPRTIRLPFWLKSLGWKLLPAPLLRKKAVQNDWICYARFTEEMRNEMISEGTTPVPRYRSLNALICQWYLTRLSKYGKKKLFD